MVQCIKTSLDDATALLHGRLAARFGDYRKDDPASFSLQPQLEYLPQFMFNLRRSQFVQVHQLSLCCCISVHITHWHTCCIHAHECTCASAKLQLLRKGYKSMDCHHLGTPYNFSDWILPRMQPCASLNHICSSTLHSMYKQHRRTAAIHSVCFSGIWQQPR